MNTRAVSRLRTFAARLRGLVSGARHDGQFDEEVQEHLRLLAERFVAQGMSREEAARAARRQFGNTTTLQEDRRALQTLPSIESLWHHVQYAARALLRQPGFTITAVVTLGLGIGLNWPQFFETLDLAILRGRAFAEADQIGAPATAIVNQALASRLWPDRDPIGQELSIDDSGGRFVQVVGVARNASLTEDARPAVFLPGRPTDDSLALLAWVDGDSARSLRAIEGALRAVDRDVPVLRSDTLRHHLDERLEAERMLSRILGIFGALALALAAIGLYGLVAYTVAARRREVGVRLALGARAGDVLRLFVFDAGRLVLTGVLIGLPLAIGVTIVLKGSFFGVQVADPIAIGTVAVVLASVVVAAAYLPARRALRVDPAVALRSAG